MAKAPRATLTRLASTIVARYFPATGATDSYYLDGRLPNRREHRAADITLDRDERGSFLAVFAHLTGTGQDEVATTRVRKSLERILTDVKQNVRNIDAEINELADCAVDVAGRITLQHDGVRQPYFAGVIVKDSEMAAITMGSGCAYLYRGDALYPLTTDDFAMDAIDYHGKPVANIDIYCAGLAGTVRYSHIAQLQLDDCLLLCNKEVMDALGQREILRLMFEAEDQADAAGLIITAASAKQPGVPMQCLISFVENIQAVDKTGRISLPQALAGTAAAAAPATGRTPPSRATASEAGSTADRPVAASQAADFTDKKARPAADSAGAATVQAQQPSGGKANYPNRRQQDQNGRFEFDNEPPAHEPDDEPDLYGSAIESGGRGRRVAVYLIIAAVCIGCVFAIYNMLFANKGSNTNTTTAPGSTTSVVQTTTPGGSTSESVITSESTDEGTEPTETDVTTTQPSTGTSTSTTETTTASGGITLPTTHTVVSGDTLYKLAVKYYGSGSAANINRIKAANNLTGTNLSIGKVLKIPAR